MLINGLINKLTESDFYCQHCTPKGSSKFEREISLFLESFGIATCANDRKTIAPLELDIYIHNKKLAIEFDGLYWHSDNTSHNRMRHLKKLYYVKSKEFSLYTYLKMNG